MDSMRVSFCDTGTLVNIENIHYALEWHLISLLPFKRFINLFDRLLERGYIKEIFHLLVHCPHYCSSRGRSQEFHSVFLNRWQNSSTWATICCFPSTLSGSWNGREGTRCQTGTLLWDLGIPTPFLMIWKNIFKERLPFISHPYCPN